MWCTPRIDSRHLLFLIYVNDMSGAVSNKLLLYADESAILVADKNTACIELSLKTEWEVISDWIADNRLPLHLGKAESILFGSKRKLRQQSELEIPCKGTQIQFKESVKDLGAILEPYLSGEAKVNSVIQKASARLNFLYRKQRYLNLHSKKLWFMTLTQCHFDYACSFWYPRLQKATSDPE